MKLLRGILETLAVIACLIFLFFIPAIKNNIHLMIFASQLAKIDDVLDGHGVLIAKGSDIFVSGNDAVCGFRAVRVYNYWAMGQEQELIQRVENMSFSSAKTVEFFEKVETYADYVDRTLIVQIVDGGYSAGLDFRCW